VNTRNEIARKVTVETNSISGAKLLLESKADPNANGGRIFVYVVWFKLIEMVKLLLDYGAKPPADKNVRGQVHIVS